MTGYKFCIWLVSHEAEGDKYTNCTVTIYESGLQKCVELPNTRHSNFEPSYHVFAIIVEKISLKLIYSVTFVHKKMGIDSNLPLKALNYFKSVQKLQNKVLFC